MPKEEEPLVLVGFGKYDLEEILSWIGTAKEREALSAPKLWPPRYRPERLCTDEDHENFVRYIEELGSKGYTQGINL